MSFRTFLFSLISFLAGAILIAPLLAANSTPLSSAASSIAMTRTDDREADRQAIRAHIEQIFKAYIAGDCAQIRATHSNNWIGFTGQARSILHGLDAYMNNSARFCQAPPSANPNPNAGNRMVDFKLTEIDYQFYGDVALVPYVAETAYGSAHVPGKLRSLDVYAKQNGHWNQVGSNIYQHPDMVQAQLEQVQAQDLRQLPPAEQQALLTAREAVWRAFFTNDQAQLDKLVPDETIVLGGSPEKPFNKKAEILESAKRGGAAGNKLIRAEFPKTEMQVYGNVAIIYTTYLYELENPQGQRQTSTGKATEIFVRRKGTWVNPGWHMSSFNQPNK